MSRMRTRGWLGAAVLGGAALLGLLRCPRVEVEGHSMRPTLAAGDRLVVLPFGVSAGRMVAARDPRDPRRLLVKRARVVTRNGVEVRGDNADHSTDSRVFGPVPLALVVGRPVYRYAPPDRAGWLWTD